MKARVPALVASLLLAGACAQLELVGAGDLSPDDPCLSTGEILRCSDDDVAVLEPERPASDRSAGGRLQGAHQPLAGRSLTHVVALDYSGSMFGGYDRSEPSEPASGCGWSLSRSGTRSPNGAFYWEQPTFRALLEQGVVAGIAAGDPVHAAVFNRDVFLLHEAGAARFDGLGFEGGLPAPDSSAGTAVARLVSPAAGGTLPARWQAPWATSRMWNESRMASALDAAATVFDAGSGDGVLWIVTDNIIDTATSDASSQEAELNRQFYLRLKEDPRWQVVYAYPVHQADWLCGGTLLVYGMYYSSHERLPEREYHTLTSGGGARLASDPQIASFARLANPGSPAPGHPFKLKPDDMDLLRVAFDRKIECPAAKAGQARQCRATLTIDNLLKHRRIDGASLRLESGRLDAWNQGLGEVVRVRTARPLPSGAITAEVEITEPIPPGGTRTVEVDLLVPPIQTEEHTLRDHWESANHEHFRMLGAMAVAISELRTSMAVDQAQLGDIYGVASLPEIFRNPNTSDLSTAICLKMWVENPAWLVSLLILGALLLLVLAIALGAWLLKPSFRVAVIDDVEIGRIRISRIAAATLEHRGRPVARVRQRLGGSLAVVGLKPYRARPFGGHWELRDAEADMGERLHLELRLRAHPGPRGRAGNDF